MASFILLLLVFTTLLDVGINAIRTRTLGNLITAIQHQSHLIVAATAQKLGAFQDAGDKCHVWHLGGVSWSDAPTPIGKHKCEAQTVGLWEDGTVVARCACGGIRMQLLHEWSGGKGWAERNGSSPDRNKATD